MGDRVAVMRDGEIQQIDPPSTVYESPTTKFVGSFIGNPPMNFVAGRIRRDVSGVTVAVGAYEFTPAVEVQPLIRGLAGDHVILGIRAENMETLVQPAADSVPVTVEVVEPLGAQNLLTVDLAGHRLKVSTHPSFPAVAKQQLHVRLPAEHIRWIDPASEQVLYA